MAEWLEKTLGGVTSFITKGIAPKYTEMENEDTIRVLNQKCNRNFEISYSESRIHDCTQKKVPADKMLRAGDVLINSTGTGTAGRVAQMTAVTVPTTIDGHMILIRPSEELDPIYYGYAVKAYQAQIECLAEGSTGQTEINRQRLQDEIIIRYPRDKAIQKSIGTFLANIDEKLKTNTAINENLLQQAQTLFNAWFVDYKPFGGVQPSDWKSISVYDLAEYINGAAFKKHEYSDTGLPIIKIAELKNGITESTQHCCVEKDPKYYIKDRDILFSWSGNPETSIDTFVWSMGYAILNQHTFRVVSKYEAPAFTFFLLKYLKPQFTHIASNKQTTGLGHVTVTDLKRLQVCTNRQGIKKFNDLTMPIFEMIYSNCKECQELSTLRDSLLPKLMSGEIDVSTLDI